MPILGPSGSPLYTTTTSAQTVINAVSQDVRQVLSSTASPDQGILLDYVNRVSLELLRASRWQFLLSPVQRFVTQLGGTDYWVGATGGNSFSQYDTGLNLTDLRAIVPGTVFDRSNFRPLQKTEAKPIAAKLFYPDSNPRLGRPAEWTQDPDSPNVLSIYPAPDNQNAYAPQPDPALCSTAVSGALAGRLYFVTVTFVDTTGKESTAPFATEIYIPANSVLVVAPPQEPLLAGTTGIKYDRYNVYAISVPVGQTATSNSCVLQASNISTSVSWQEPNTGLLTTGSTPPGVNSVAPIAGYIIEFRYLKQRAQITTTSQILQIPDDYKDVVISGVNAHAYRYLLRPQESQEWFALYRNGITEIVRDINYLQRSGTDYIKPDAATIGGSLPAVESIDLSVLIP